jgi:predicted amidophosphoribosyltransferase
MNFLSTPSFFMSAENICQNPITKETVFDCWHKNPKRICFATTHLNALKREDSQYGIGKFSIPFTNTVYPIFYADTQIKLWESQYKTWWLSIRTEAEFDTIQQWINKVEGIVFLRDSLALSLALSENMKNDTQRTNMGELEYQAKYSQDEDVKKNAVVALYKLLSTKITQLPFYNQADLLCAIPPSNSNKFSLPNFLVANLAKKLNTTDITEYLNWQNEKPSLKELEVHQKWDTLELVGLNVNINLEGKTVLLLDNLYQSGMTMQYVAMRLQQAGAKAIYGLSIVKSRRDTDNR